MDIRKYLIEGNIEKCLELYKDDTLSKVKLINIIIEEIGLGNIQLIKNIILNGINKDFIKSICLSFKSGQKSKLCLYLVYYFYEALRYPIEPFSDNMIDFGKNMQKTLIIAGVMFYKNIDIWKILTKNMNPDDIKFINELSKYKSPTIWIFGLFYKYKWELPNQIEYKKLFLSYASKSYLFTSNKIYSDYFCVVKNDSVINQKNVPDNLKISTSDKNMYKINKSDKFIESKYKLDEIIEFKSPKVEKRLHLSDLGTLQLVNNDIYCWISGSRYILRSFKTKQLAKLSNEANNLMNKISLEYPFSQKSYILYISEIVDDSEKGSIVDKKSYYVITEEISYYMILSKQISCFDRQSLQNDNNNIKKDIILANISKYILGIEGELGVYYDNYKLRIFINSIYPLLTSKISLKEKYIIDNYIIEWLNNLELGRKFYTRISEIITINI